MNTQDLQSRWKSAEMREVVDHVRQFLIGEIDALPRRVDTHEGRADLRGIELPMPKHGPRVGARGVGAVLLTDTIEIRDRRLASLDLSGARLNGLRFFNTEIVNCRFDSASCVDWRLWNSRVENCTYVAANLRDSVILSWHDGRGNTWRNVDFSRADLRGIFAHGGIVDGCDFSNARLIKIEFKRVEFRDTRFAGSIQEVIFDERPFDGEPPSRPLVRLDFSNATFRLVEFWGCRFEGVTLPSGVVAVPNFLETAAERVKVLDGDDSVEARDVRAEIDYMKHIHYPTDSVFVFNRADYVALGGEELAKKAETVYLN